MSSSLLIQSKRYIVSALHHQVPKLAVLALSAGIVHNLAHPLWQMLIHS